MPNISVAEVKPGSKIIKDVVTPLGGVLFPKGKIILPRDVEILQAFLIQQVEIEGNQERLYLLKMLKQPRRRCQSRQEHSLMSQCWPRAIPLYMMNMRRC